MLPHSPRALHVRQYALGAALLAFLASYVHEPSVEVVAVFGIVAVVGLAVAQVFDVTGRAARAWAVPTIAAVVVLVSDTAMHQRLLALAITGYAVIGSLVYPLTGSVTELEDRARKYLR